MFAACFVWLPILYLNQILAIAVNTDTIQDHKISGEHGYVTICADQHSLLVSLLRY